MVLTVLWMFDCGGTLLVSWSNPLVFYVLFSLKDDLSLDCVSGFRVKSKPSAFPNLLLVNRGDRSLFVVSSIVCCS